MKKTYSEKKQYNLEKFNGAKPLKAISKVRAYEKALLEMRGRMDGRIKSLKSAWPKFNDAITMIASDRPILIIEEF